MTDSLTPTPMAKNADSALHVGNDFPPGRPKGNQPPLGAATREAAEREGQEFTAGPPQGEFAPPRGAATREAAERGGTAPLIRLRGITKVYGSGSTAFQALKGVDLDIQRGDFVAIMGPSGSGKSTAMNTLGCLDTPTTGIYEYQGVQVQSLSRDQRARLRRRYLGFVFQGFNLLARTSAQENVELPLIYRGEPAARRHAMAARALDAVGLKGWEHHTPGELSGGQQQRVAIARAIVTEPAVLLADEPTGNLDTARSQEIMELLWHLNADLGITVLMVTHEPDMAAYARRMVRFVDGVVASDERNPHPVAMRAAPAEGAV
jgi:putative ABC transport system ATP-binding protein